MRFVLVCAMLLCFTLTACAGVKKNGLGIAFTEHKDVAEVFANAKGTGTFILLYPDNNEYTGHNGKRAAERFIPGTSFAVPCALLALENGTVKDVNEMIMYRSRVQPIMANQKFISLKAAMDTIATPTFLALSRGMGAETIRKGLESFDYGNWKDIPENAPPAHATARAPGLAPGQAPGLAPASKPAASSATTASAVSAAPAASGTLGASKAPVASAASAASAVSGPSGPSAAKTNVPAPTPSGAKPSGAAASNTADTEAHTTPKPPADAGFWLTGPLRISAHEQAVFMNKLAKKALPLPEKVQKTVHDIMPVEQGDGWKLFTRTGGTSDNGATIGWWIGWLEREGKIYPFALNMNLEEDMPFNIQKNLGKECLRAMGLLP